LLEGIPNQEKNDSEFKDWLSGKYTSDKAVQSFKEKNYIPDDVDLDLRNFRQFVEERRTLLSNRLMTLLKPE
jgi:hypothetical protein